MEKQTFTNKQVVGTSIAIGVFLSVFIVFSFAPPVDLLFVLPLALLFSITGGFLGKKWRDSPQAIIVGATLGTVLAAPIGIASARIILFYILCC